MDKPSVQISDANPEKIDIYNMDRRLKLSKVIECKKVDIDISCLRQEAMLRVS
jgi:hypothetical protein